VGNELPDVVRGRPDLRVPAGFRGTRHALTKRPVRRARPRESLHRLAVHVNGDSVVEPEAARRRTRRPRSDSRADAVTLFPSAGASGICPLDSDVRRHRNRPLALSAQRTTDRLRASRCILSSVFSFRNRTCSARSDSDSGAPPPSRPRHALVTQLPSVPWLTPGFRKWTSTAARAFEGRSSAGSPTQRSRAVLSAARFDRPQRSSSPLSQFCHIVSDLSRAAVDPSILSEHLTPEPGGS
jgi:hypothetical protein